MAFSINFLDKTTLLKSAQDDFKEVLDTDDIEAAEITIGDFKEVFLSSVDYWHVTEYQKHWAETVEKILNGECDKTALIVNMHDPKDANYLNCWPLYREGDTIYIHNQLLFISQIKEFDIANLPEYVDARQTVNQDGDAISEWATSADELQVWAAELRKIVG